MAIRRPLDVPGELLNAFVQCGDVSAYLVSILPERVWRAGSPNGRGRTIAAIVAHMLSLRRTFVRMGGDRSVRALDRRTMTRAQAIAAFEASTARLADQFRQTMADGRVRAKGHPRRVVDMVTYLMQHDAHHRGQITTLARALDHRFTAEEVTRLWGWKKLPRPR